jgi:hypothetical protein
VAQADSINLEDAEGMQRLYKINPGLFQTLLLNQIVQNTKMVRQIMQREEFEGKVKPITQAFTPAPLYVDFRGAWKVVQLNNRGPDTFSFVLLTLEKEGSKEQEKPQPEIDVDAYDSLNVPMRENRILGLIGHAGTTTTTVKMLLVR